MGNSFASLALTACCAAAMGCGSSFSAVAKQPNPLSAPTEIDRESAKITIVTGDMELRAPRLPTGNQQVAIYRTNRYPLFNTARFVVVSRDRLRFHVQIDHKWDEWADLRTWDIELVDDAGNHYIPEIDRARTRLMVTMWDNEIRTAVRNSYGDVVAIENDGYKHRVPMGSLNVFRGTADLVFYRRDIFRPDIKWLKLRISRFGQAFNFTWKFTDEDGAPTMANSEAKPTAS
ncbi:MAG TPA: hypothetical protein PLF40_23960 [Kofleriaceae bacterium]|nr:hypothetical protein [Kofleriaceae bacterium]